MKLIVFELKKLLGMRFLCVCLLVLLAICFALSFFAAENSQKDTVPRKELNAFFTLYFENRAEMDAYYKQLVQDEIHDPMQEQRPQQAEQKFAPDGYTDLQMFSALYAAAFAGALAVTLLILFFATRLRSNSMLLIIGMMVGYVVSSIVSLLNFFSTAEGVQSYMMWGMGNFGGVSRTQLPLFGTLVLVGLAIAISLVKPLNALLLGDRYARNLGINIHRTRTLLLLATGLLVAVTTSYCGPINFIGLAVPHIARLVLGTGNHRTLMPTTLLTGSLIALLCNLISILPGDRGLLPLNAITPIIGAPVIIYVIMSRRKNLR